MSKFHFSVVLVITIVFIDVSFLSLLQAGEPMKLEADKTSYKISLSSIGGAPQYINSAINFEGSIAWLNPPQIWITVEKPARDSSENFNLVWSYAMGPLRVGDDFVMQGRLYEVAAIDIKQMKFIPPYQFDGFCREESCNPSAEITMVGKISPTSQGDTILLSKVTNYFNLPQANGVSLWKNNQCYLDIFLGDVEKNGHGYVANIKSVLRSAAGAYGGAECPAERRGKDSHGFVKASEGEVIDFGSFGRFVVESIFPAQPRHSDWVILVPEANTETETGSRTGPSQTPRATPVPIIKTAKPGSE